MRNLKKMLSLVMALAMIASFMVVGASAAGFTDVKDIKNGDAVNTLVSLNIIAGYDTGDFKPTGIVTRAEMAKMITIALNGGKEPILGTKNTPTYTDIKGNWAESYIEYCTTLGIISGMGDGTFVPNATVTGTQAAKMLLVAMGWDSTVFKFTGPDWAISVNVEANKIDLYDNLEGLNANDGLTRDNAAQLIYNGLQAQTMAKTPSLTITNGEITYTYGPSGTTLLKDKYNVDIFEGVLTATGDYDLTSRLNPLGSASASKEGFVVNYKKLNGITTTTVGGAVVTTNDRYFKAKDMDLTDMMGRYVKVLYNTSKEVLYGVYLVDGMNTVVDTNVTKVSYPADQATKVKIDGTLYAMEAVGGVRSLNIIRGEAVGSYNDTFNDGDVNTLPNRVRADKVTYIDNDGNGKFDVALVTPMNVAEVTFLSTTNVTLAKQSGDANAYSPKTLSPKLENIIYTEGMKKGDFVQVTRDFYTDNDKLEVLDKTTGAVTGVKGNPTLAGFQVDGDWYSVAQGYTMPTTVKSAASMDYVAVNGVIYYAKLTSAAQGSKDLALISALSYGAAGTFDAGDLSAKIMLADGTKKTVNVAKLCNDINTPSVALVAPVDGVEQAFMNQIVTYKVNNDGDYEFTKVTSNNDAGYDSFVIGTASPGTNTSDNNINGTVVSDDASILLVANQAGLNALSVKYITGKEYKAINNSANAKFTASAASIVVGKDADGFNRVRAAVVLATNASGAGVTTAAYNTTDDKWTLGVFTGSNFGYLTTSSWTETISGTQYNVFKFWNGNDTVTMREKNSTEANLAARTVISYDVVDNETIKNVSTSGLTQGALQAFSSNSANLDGLEYKMTKDTVILNINDTDKVGQQGTSLAAAREIGNTGVYVDNCYYYVAGGAGSDVLAIVIDVSKNQLNSVSGLIETSPAVLTDGVGINGTKIGVPTGTSAALASGDQAAIATYVGTLFTNEISLVVNVSGGVCSTVTVTGPNGVPSTYDLVLGYVTVASTIKLAASASADIAAIKADTNFTAAITATKSTLVNLYTDSGCTTPATLGVADGAASTVTLYAKLTAANGDTITTGAITVQAFNHT